LTVTSDKPFGQGEVSGDEVAAMIDRLPGALLCG
jgi:hypothetical protein